MIVMRYFENLLKLKYSWFEPDFSETENDNWIRFLQGGGGTSREWEKLKSVNGWTFYDPYRDYFSLLHKIENDWFVLYNSKDYHGNMAGMMEKDCLIDIEYYEKMRKYDIKHHEKPPTDIPAFKRLAMLYERQGKLEEAVTVCRKACSYGMDESKRMKNLLKKIGREPTAAEARQIYKFSCNK